MILSGRSAKMGIKSSRLYLPRHLAFYDHGPRNHSIIKTKTKILRVNPLTSLLPWFSSPPPTLWPLPCLPFFRDLPPLPTPHRQHPLSLGYPRSYFFLLFSVSHSLQSYSQLEAHSIQRSLKHILKRSRSHKQSLKLKLTLSQAHLLLPLQGREVLVRSELKDIRSRMTWGNSRDSKIRDRP